MIDALWVTLTVSCLIGVWLMVALLAWLGRTAQELLHFLKHQEFARPHERDLRQDLRTMVREHFHQHHPPGG
jgi:hypothetical protein